jgi:hypothetical protein
MEDNQVGIEDSRLLAQVALVRLSRLPVPLRGMLSR